MTPALHCTIPWLRILQTNFCRQRPFLSQLALGWPQLTHVLPLTPAMHTPCSGILQTKFGDLGNDLQTWIVGVSLMFLKVCSRVDVQQYGRHYHEQQFLFLECEVKKCHAYNPNLLNPFWGCSVSIWESVTFMKVKIIVYQGKSYIIAKRNV